MDWHGTLWPARSWIAFAIGSYSLVFGFPVDFGVSLLVSTAWLSLWFGWRHLEAPGMWARIKLIVPNGMAVPVGGCEPKQAQSGLIKHHKDQADQFGQTDRYTHRQCTQTMRKANRQTDRLIGGEPRCLSSELNGL